MKTPLLQLIFGSLLFAAPPYAGLPDRAVVLEEQKLPSSTHVERALVLWVLAPPDGRLHDLGVDSDESAYTCPQQTEGHYYRAPTRVSLVDAVSRTVINTVPIRWLPVDAYDITFRLRPGYFYQVLGPLTTGSGSPHILALRDLNGDGKALEFCFYVMEDCTGPETMVVGYSERQDRVIIYSFHLRGNLFDRKDPVTEWMDRFAMQKPISPMLWRYDFWYNSGLHVSFDFRYLPDREDFEGTVRTADSADDLFRKPGTAKK
jgi:hypothetical protein